MTQTTIKLTLQIGAKQTEKVFSQDSVLFGTHSSDLRDLPFDTSFMLPEHVKIFVKDGVFFAQNLANDPFVAVNERPFGKKKLNSGDRLTIGELEVLFEGQTIAPSQRPTPRPLQSLSDSLERTMLKTPPRLKHEPIVEEDEDLEALIREVESFEAEEALQAHAHDHAAFNANALHSTVTDVPGQVGRHTLEHSPQASNTRSLKERHPSKSKRLLDLDGTVLAAKNHFGVQESRHKSLWRPLLVIIFVLIALMLAVGSGFYFTFSEKSDEEEFIAAQGLADMGIALTYAQQHQLKSPNQNWGDPDFLKEALAHVLPPAYPSLIALDKQGLFTDSPYMLRIYTNNDLSQFLLIAQPEPSLWQWLLPRETILLDSRTMELHKTTDLRALNRLLANTKPLDGANALEVSHLVSEASLIRLTLLANETGHREFLPPKGLSKLLPGAEHHLYNAPRYFRMSASLVHALAAYLEQQEEAADDVAQDLRNKIVDYRKLPNAILYSDLSESTTRKIESLLKSWFVDQPAPVIAELQLEKGSGRILSTYLLGNKRLDVSDDEFPTEAEFIGENSEQSPQLRALYSAVTTRKQALEGYKERLSSLLKEQIASPKEHFFETAMQMIREFNDIDIGEQVDIRQAIVDVYRSEVLENNALSHQDFVVEVKGTDIEPFLPPEFFEAQEPVPAPLVAEGERELVDHGVEFSAALLQVQHATDFKSLEAAIAAANQALSREPLPNDERLRTSRNKLQVQVVHRLEQLLLGAGSPLPDAAFDHHNRSRLQHILLSAGIEDQEQLDYYLHEYDILMNQKHRVRN